MNKTQWMIPLSASLLLGVAGCTGDKTGVNENGKSSLRPVGYYSNENHSNYHNDYDLSRDNDGAITEIMDHNLGDEDQIARQKNIQQMQARDDNGNPKNPTTPLANKDRNFFQRDNRFSTSDMNYHGHLSTNINNTGVVTDPNFQDQVTSRIRNKVENLDNVQAVRSVAYGNTVIVSVTLQDKDKAAETKREIKKAVKPYANGKSVTVYTDEGTMGRDRNVDNDFQRNKGGK